MTNSARKLVTWNIRHGGGSGDRQRRIIDILLSFGADLLVVTEFRLGNTGNVLKAALTAAGYHLSHPPTDVGLNTVLVASSQPIDQVGTLDPTVADARHLWRVVTSGVRLAGVYMPVGVAKVPYWNSVVRAASNGDFVDIFIGDFNTGRNDLDKAPRGEPYVGAEFMDQISLADYIDLWRTRHSLDREYSWFSPQGRNGFRLDHAFASPPFAASVRDCWYDHAPRLEAVSDHSALIVEFDTRLPKVNGQALPREAPVIGSLYVFDDPGCPGLLKIGKDQKWPQRLRQAQSHTPRGMREIGRWTFSGESRSKLAAMERCIIAKFERELSCPGREWVRGDSREVLNTVSKILGQSQPQTDLVSVRPYDDWRDWEKPLRSEKPRRLWIGCERQTGRLKVVHSVHVELFRTLCPTYSRYGIDWLETWEWPTAAWSPSPSVHPLDQILVDFWIELVTNCGYGPRDPRVGWLREKVSLSAIQERCQSVGLLPGILRSISPHQTLESPISSR